MEGSTVMTKYGPVKTDYIIYSCRIFMLLNRRIDSCLQDAFQFRELDSLTQEDFYRILTEPANALLKQYTELKNRRC